MLFRRDVLEGIAAGEVTLAFRRWRRPAARAGGTQRTAVGVVAFDAVERVDADDISDDDVRRPPWTRLLALIALHPATPARDLAARTGQPVARLKADVHRMKDLGLTESLGTGYRPSPRGEALRAARRPAR